MPSRHLGNSLLILGVSSCSSFLWRACVQYLKPNKTQGGTWSVSPPVLASMQSCVKAVLLVRREEELGLIPTSFGVVKNSVCVLGDLHRSCIARSQQQCLMFSLSPVLRSREVAYQMVTGDLDEFCRKARELMVGFAAESVRMLFTTHLGTYLCQETLIHVCCSLTEHLVWGQTRW